MGQYKSRDAWDATRLSDERREEGGPSPADEAKREDYELGNLSLSESPSPPVVQTSKAAWWLTGLVAIGAALFFALVHLPVIQQSREQAHELALATDTNARLSARLAELDQARTELEAAQAQLQSAVEQKEQALAELTRAQEELAQKLEQEIKKGDVLINQRAGQLVVELVDQILFDSGEAELNDQGKAVLKKVGETLLKVPDKVLEVGGHTDNVPISPKLVDRFPSNWELSTARATNVVRFLADEVKVPGSRLVATGFSEFRPVTSNTTKSGRRKNRRIEVVLLPALAKK